MSSALARYESFLIQNVSTISSLESTLRSVTWLLPGRFKDAELVSEACQFVPLSPYSPFLDLAHVSVRFTQCLEPVPRYPPHQGN
jgi:peroxin-16